MGPPRSRGPGARLGWAKQSTNTGTEGTNLREWDGMQPRAGDCGARMRVRAFACAAPRPRTAAAPQCHRHRHPGAPLPTPAAASCWTGDTSHAAAHRCHPRRAWQQLACAALTTGRRRWRAAAGDCRRPPAGNGAPHQARPAVRGPMAGGMAAAGCCSGQPMHPPVAMFVGAPALPGPRPRGWPRQAPELMWRRPHPAALPRGTAARQPIPQKCKRRTSPAHHARPAAAWLRQCSAVPPAAAARRTLCTRARMRWRAAAPAPLVHARQPPAWRSAAASSSQVG
jgi:hypothetical protein